LNVIKVVFLFTKNHQFAAMSNYLIAGLGNIGDEYAETRHNIGFKVVEELAARNKLSFSLDRHAHVCTYKFKGRNVTLIKPTTYMNLSGKAVSYWMDQANVKKENLLVVLDDVAIAFGAIRIRPKGSDGGHNGLKDIDLVLRGNDYPRLRFGIGNNYHKGQQVNYVLGKWNAEEAKDLGSHVISAANAVECFIFEGLANAMNKYNKG
jgi:peptidyl-tRNA hydrolase, PTH1 family